MRFATPLAWFCFTRSRYLCTLVCNGDKIGHNQKCMREMARMLYHNQSDPHSIDSPKLLKVVEGLKILQVNYIK